MGDGFDGPSGLQNMGKGLNFSVKRDDMIQRGRVEKIFEGRRKV
jgi:hypothetical protein